MGRRDRERKGKAKSDNEGEGVESKRRKPSHDSDDEEGNEDLSLKIVEKAMLRASYAAIDGVDVGNSNVTSGEDVIATELAASRIVKKKSKKEKEKKKKKVKKVESEIQTVSIAKEESITDTIKDVEVVKLPEIDADDNTNSDNVVLRRLLRGPRYFDPPDKSWGACFNCGEEGHSAANCTMARRKKPCFICGSLEHEAKQCQKGKDCFICKGGGHRAKDCPKKFKQCSQQSEWCLRCGASAHAMSSCNNDYSLDDLKEIQCYVCKSFGHLCCANYFDGLPTEASCYKCGQSGHSGLECRGSRGETSSAGTPSSCFRCGEEGHFARECTNSTKVKKRTRDLSTPTGKHSSGNKSNKGYKSTPRDTNKTPKKKKLQFDDGSPDRSSHKRWGGGDGSPGWSSKSKRWGGGYGGGGDGSPGWSSNSKRWGGGVIDERWRSPATPNNKQKIYGSGGGHSSSWQSPKKWSNYSSGNSSSQGFARSYGHRFSASRFGNASSDGMRRNYDMW